MSARCKGRAVPYNPPEQRAPGWPRPGRDQMPWSNQGGGGGPWGSGPKGPWGSGPQSDGWIDAARSRRSAAAQPGQAQDRAAGRQSRRPWRRCCAVVLALVPVGHFRILRGAAGRTRRRAAIRQICPRSFRPAGAITGPIRSRAVTKVNIERINQHRCRHAHQFDDCAARHDDARRAGREPDADRRREYRRCRFRRALEDQAGRGAASFCSTSSIRKAR